jgi:hypothetical protein
MLRFVDISEAYWCDEDDARESPCCMIINTVNDTALANDTGNHVLTDMLDVQEAGGDRAMALVPDGFFAVRVVRV